MINFDNIDYVLGEVDALFEAFIYKQKTPTYKINTCFKLKVYTRLSH